MLFIAISLGFINSYLLFCLVNATTTMWVIFWVYLVMFVFGTLLAGLGED